jgi:hypothetical protein
MRRLNSINRHWPLWFSLAVLSLICGWIIVETCRRTDGRFTYALDDAYIHMAVARNLAESGTWGIRPGEFVSASSSLAWTAILATTFSVFGVYDYSAALLACAMGLVCLWTVYRIARREHWPEYWIAGILLAFVGVLPLASMMLLGMEHTLHTWVTIVILYAAADLLVEEPTHDAHPRTAWTLVLLSPLMTSVRYEGLFLAFVVCVCFILRGRWRLSLMTGSMAWLPIVVFGLYSRAQGGFFFPNSVLRKGSTPSIDNVRLLAEMLSGLRAVHGLFAVQALFSLVVALLVVWLWLDSGKGLPSTEFSPRESRTLARSRWLVILLLPTICLHMMLAGTWHFFRYESYLVGAAIVTLGSLTAPLLPQTLPAFSRRAVKEWPRVWLPATLLIVLLLLPNLERALTAAWVSLRGSKGIFMQQVQMARFVRTYYPHNTIALNDIGAVCYYTDAPVLDLWGIASNDALILHRRGIDNPRAIAELCVEHQVKLAMIYRHWFPAIPEEWTLVGTWQIPERMKSLLGGTSVSFYATDRAEAAELAEHLREFRTQLPREVTTTIELSSKAPE